MTRSATQPSAVPQPGGYRGEGVKLAEQTAAKIELAIAEAGWPLGTVIGSEADLLATYGVSRAVLREAVRLLEHDNVAHMRRGPGGGLVVAEPDADAVVRVATLYLRYRNVSPGQLFRARIAVELAAVRSAAEHIDERGVARLRAALEREAAAPELADVQTHDVHLVIARLAGNPAVELFTDVLTKLSATALMGGPALVDRTAAATIANTAWADAHTAHQGIAEAVIAGDAALAQHRTARHLQALAAAVDPDHGADVIVPD
jgi:DNA-binding FadR family transcriptional regulator